MCKCYKLSCKLIIKWSIRFYFSLPNIACLLWERMSDYFLLGSDQIEPFPICLHVNITINWSRDFAHVTLSFERCVLEGAGGQNGAVTSRYSAVFCAWPVCFTLSLLYPVCFGGGVKQTLGKVDYVLPSVWFTLSPLYPSESRLGKKKLWVKRTPLYPQSTLPLVSPGKADLG